jgi:hypothetical protein
VDFTQHQGSEQQELEPDDLPCSPLPCITQARFLFCAWNMARITTSGTPSECNFLSASGDVFVPLSIYCFALQ